MQEQGSTLATFVLPIAQALRKHGVDSMEVCERVGIDPAFVINPDRRIPRQKMQRLWAAAVQETDDESFGLLAAEQIQPAELHGLGLAWLTSDNIYDALRRLVRFAQVLSTGIGMELHESDDTVDILYTSPEVSHFVHAASDFAIGMILHMCHLTLGHRIVPLKVSVTRPQPGNPDRFSFFLGDNVTYGADINRLSFSRDEVMKPLPTGVPELAKANDELVLQYLASFTDTSTAREVVAKIVEQLPDGPPNQQQIAESLHVSNRTLQRKLKDEGTSFLDLLQDTRLQLARKYLAQPSRSIVEIAYMLGFSEPSTFSRAFKRWTGQAPADYREAMH